MRQTEHIVQKLFLVLLHSSSVRSNPELYKSLGDSDVMSASSRAEKKSCCGRPMNFCGPLSISSRWHETKMWEWSGCSCRKQANGFKKQLLLSTGSRSLILTPFHSWHLFDYCFGLPSILCSLRVHRFNLHSLSNRKSRGFFLTPFIDSTFFV